MSLNDIKDTMEELKNCVNCKHFSWEEYEIVKQACVYELAQAVMRYGDKFHSMHEAWAILKEEIEEVEYNFNRIKEYLDFLWKLVKRDSDSTKEYVIHIQDFTLDLMNELAKVWAVCEKMKEGVEK